MKTWNFNTYVVSAWGERSGDGWLGLASVAPPISNTWTGGPKGDSLVIDGVHASEVVAEDAALLKALAAVTAHIESGRPHA